MLHSLPVSTSVSESMASILEAEVNFENNPEAHPSDEKDSKDYGMLEKKVR